MSDPFRTPADPPPLKILDEDDLEDEEDEGEWYKGGLLFRANGCKCRPPARHCWYWFDPDIQHGDRWRCEHGREFTAEDDSYWRDPKGKLMR